MTRAFAGMGVLVALLAGGGLSAQESGNPTSFAGVRFAPNDQQLNRLAGRGVALADLNGDSFLDAFVVNASTPDGEGDRVYFGDGRGHLTDGGQRLASDWEGKPAIGHVNGDGKLDVVTGGTVWVNSGNGHLEAVPEPIAASGAELTGPIQLADLDGDGDLDLVAVSGWKSLRVYLNDGKGRSRDSGQRLGAGIIGSLAVGDVDGDGVTDVVSGGWRSAGSDYAPSRVWVNDGKGNLTDVGPIDHGENHVHGVALGDVDGNGHLRDRGQTLAHRWAHAVALGDLDGDGSLDVFLACGEPATGTPNEIWLNDGKGSFRDSGLRLGDAFSWDVALGDLNRDGRLDAFVVNLRLVDDSKHPPVFGGTAAEVWLNTPPPPEASFRGVRDFAGGSFESLATGMRCLQSVLEAE